MKFLILILIFWVEAPLAVSDYSSSVDDRCIYSTNENPHTVANYSNFLTNLKSKRKKAKERRMRDGRGSGQK